MPPERSVGALQHAIGLSQSALSQHLARLRADGVVATRRQSQTIYYALASEKVVRLISLLYELYCAPADGGESATGERVGRKTE